MPSAAYNIVLLQLPGYPHAMALWDIGRLLNCSFQSLGFQSELRVNALDSKTVNVLLGYHQITAASLPRRCNFVIYQLEQLADAEGFFDATRLEVLQRAHEIWDYSPDNIAFLKDKGLSNVKYLPIGFHQALQSIPQAQKDIDILFYGSINDRRKMILEELQKKCRLQSLFELYGPERDAWISRSKIVLNLHYYETRMMQQARISYLLNNICCVVSEDSSQNPYEGMIATAPYSQVVETCLHYLHNDDEREAMARRGYELFCKRPMVEYLRPVIAGGA
jgi:hypothetical protein